MSAQQESQPLMMIKSSTSHFESRFSIPIMPDADGVMRDAEGKAVDLNTLAALCNSIVAIAATIAPSKLTDTPDHYGFGGEDLYYVFPNGEVSTTLGDQLGYQMVFATSPEEALALSMFDTTA